MADTEKHGLIARWLIGKERDEDYARSTLPTNRWSLFWDIFKGRIGRLVIVNLMVLVTCLPFIAALILRYLMIGSMGLSAPFGGAMGWSFPIVPQITGEAQLMVMQSDLFFFALLIPAGAIASIGLSGGMYIIRNLIWTEGVFVAYDFWRGVKKNYFNVLEAVLVFTIVLYLARTMGNLADVWVATGAAGAGWMIASKVVGYIFVAFFLLVAMWMISLGVNYKQGPWTLLRNAVVMTVGTFPQTVFFAALAGWPFLLVFLGGMSFFGIIGYILLILLSFSYALLVWMDYCQWAFDRFINPNLGFQTGRGLYDKDKPSAAGGKTLTDAESEAMREYKRQIIATGKSKLASKPIKPIDDGVEVYQLSEGFSREDLQKLRESKQELEKGVKEYEQEHSGDEQFVAYNREFDELEKALRAEDEEKKQKNKKKRKKRPELLSK